MSRPGRRWLDGCRGLRRWVALTVALLSAVGCGQDPLSAPPPAASVVVIPALDSLGVPGQTVQLVAVARDSLGNTMTGRSLAWSSSDPAVATVDTNGLVTAVGHGASTVTATVDDVHGSATITVDLLIAFQSDRTGDFNIVALRSNGSDFIYVTRTNHREIHPAWSRDHRRVAFTTDAEPRGLRIMNADGSGLRAVFAEPGDDKYPAWSPDGERLAFRSSRGNRSGIWIANADGTGLRKVTSLDDSETLPSWSAGGRRIAFERSGGIYEVYLDGSGLRLLIPPGAGTVDGAPALSPDGTRIAFQRSFSSPGGGQSRIFVANADGSQARQVSFFATGTDWTPAWSPDGRRIVFVHEIDGQFDLYVVGADGEGQTRITTNGGIQFRPAW